MEALSLPRGGRLARVAEAAAAPGPGPWLLGLLLAAIAFAAFSGGAIEIAAAARLQAAVAALGLACALALLAGALRAGDAPLAWAGVALLLGFALWSALSMLWSAAPDDSWLAANRALTYAVAAAVAICAAASTREAPALAAAGIGAVVALVALYALGGKVAPGLGLGPLDLDPGSGFARLREPIDYWNGLGLLCVMASPVLIWLASSRAPATVVRVGSLLALAVVVLTAALTYSRGAIIAYAVVLAILVGAGPRRLPRLAVGLGAPLAMAPCIVLAFPDDDLSSNGVPLAAREDAGLLLGAVLVLSLLGLAVLGRELVRLEARRTWTADHSRRAWRAIAASAAALMVAGVVALAVSDRGLGGEISHQVDQFSKPQSLPGNTPGRLVSSNGSNRYVWWEEGVGAFADKPIAGWGAGSFPTLHYFYRRYEAPVRSAHSLPLQLLSETGLIGAGLGLGALGLLGAAAVAGVRRSAGIERSARLALLAAGAAWAAHSLYDWDWEIPALTISALLAVCVAAVPAPSGGRPRPPLSGGAAAAAGAAAALAAVAMAVSGALPALSEEKRLAALEASARGELGAAAADAELAQALNPLSVEPLFTRASIANAQGQPRLAAAFLREATRAQPDDWQTWKRLATIDAQLGDRSGGAEALRRWSATDPFLFGEVAGTIAGNAFALEVPSSRSPTAYGTPPP